VKLAEILTNGSVAPARLAGLDFGRYSNLWTSHVPSPPRRGAPPHPSRLTSRAHTAIKDDNTIDFQVRVAVLNDLEGAANTETEFTRICDGESFRGPSTTSLHKVGHMMTTVNFERGLIRGWFGKAPMPTGVARILVNDMSAERHLSGTPAYLGKLRSKLDPGARPVPQDRVVTWYFHDTADTDHPMKHVARELALRLALPSATGAPTGSGRKQDYIVFQFLAGSLADPRRPRFTDCCVLVYLELWRPGGKTDPWAAGLSGLDELVDPPLVIGREVEDVHVLECD
jgi:hypothetical protein